MGRKFRWREGDEKKGGCKILFIAGHLYYVAKSIFLFKRPVSLMRNYYRRTQPNSQLIELRNGLKIKLSSHPHDTITAIVILIKHDYGRVAKGSIVIDIGANIGVFSLWAACCGAQKIYAYEPNREAFETLRENIRLNHYEGRIIPFHLAVSDHGDLKAKIPAKASPYNQLVKGGGGEDGEWVEVTTLKEIISENGIEKADVLKIDCEGEEYNILLKLEDEVLFRIGKIRMEFHNGPLESLIHFLETRNFRIERLVPENRMLWMEKIENSTFVSSQGGGMKAPEKGDK